MPQNATVKPKRWGYYRPKIRGRREDISFILAGHRGRITFDPCFDKRGTGSRAILTISIDIGNFIYGVLFQHYREGYDFDKHQDGVPENLVFTVLLKRPKEGGEFFVHGPSKSWLRGRLRYFDGGRYAHGVTKILKGSRAVLMFQRGRRRIEA